MEPPQPKPAPKLAELPVNERRVDDLELVATRDADLFVPPPVPVDLAVGLLDIVEPEEQMPLELSDGAPIVPVLPELTELPVLERRPDVPNLFPRPDVVLPEEDYQRRGRARPLSRPLRSPLNRSRRNLPNCRC